VGSLIALSVSLASGVAVAAAVTFWEGSRHPQDAAELPWARIVVIGLVASLVWLLGLYRWPLAKR
jgi:hypothetical protein